MGNCLAALFGRPKRPRSYFTGRYKDYNVGVEFDNLIDDENDNAEESNVISQTEKELLINRQFSKLVEDQRKVDAEIDEVLRQEEERTRLEEEAYIAAKKEAAQIARQARKLEEQKRNKPVSNGSVKSWAGADGDWSLANEEEEDFDSFLQTVTARSENVRASVASLTNSHLAHTHPNNTPSDLANLDLLTSDLPWQDLTGIGGIIEVKPEFIPMPVSTTSANQMPFPNSTSSALFSSQKSDVEWEADFVSAEMAPVPSLPVSITGDARINSRDKHQDENGGVTPVANSAKEKSDGSQVALSQNSVTGVVAASAQGDCAASDSQLHQNSYKADIAKSVKVNVTSDKNGTETCPVKPTADSSSDKEVKSEKPQGRVSAPEDTDNKLPTNSRGSTSRSQRDLPARESFSITDEEDDEEILDSRSKSTELSEDSGFSMLDGESPKETTKIEAEAFDIDIDKFLEELDAEL